MSAGRTLPSERRLGTARLLTLWSAAPSIDRELSLYERPRTRGDCLPGGCNAARPCPFVSCRWHLYLDVSASIGAIRQTFAAREPWELQETCALDVADRGGETLEHVGRLVGITRERVRQIEVRATRQLRPPARRLVELLEPELDRCPAVARNAGTVRVYAAGSDQSSPPRGAA